MSTKQMVYVMDCLHCGTAAITTINGKHPCAGVNAMKAAGISSSSERTRDQACGITCRRASTAKQLLDHGKVVQTNG